MFCDSTVKSMQKRGQLMCVERGGIDRDGDGVVTAEEQAFADMMAKKKPWDATPNLRTWEARIAFGLLPVCRRRRRKCVRGYVSLTHIGNGVFHHFFFQEKHWTLEQRKFFEKKHRDDKIAAEFPAKDKAAKALEKKIRERNEDRWQLELEEWRVF